MRYQLKLMDTLSGTGCFAAFPVPNLSFSDVLNHLEKHPYDEFMHHHMLDMLGKHRTRKIEKLITEIKGDPNKKVLAALIYEACLTHPKLVSLKEQIEKDFDAQELKDITPTLHLRSHLLADQPLHNQWTLVLSANMEEHEDLPSPEETGLPLLYKNEELPVKESIEASTVKTSLEKEGKLPPAKERASTIEVTTHAMKQLEALDVFLGQQMRQKGCLSPAAVLQHWQVKTKTDNGSLSNSLDAIQTSYGRGFSLIDAQVSCAMEVVERVSSYGSIGKAGVLNRVDPYPIVKGTYEEVSKDCKALDPSTLSLEYPYEGQSLWWMEADRFNGTEYEEILIPVQHVFLFCNLDEQNLFSGLSSTGLASGNTFAEAQLSGLLEVLERDSDSTILFDKEKCFRIESDNAEIKKHLADLEDSGIHVWFQDMTSELGVPCYRAFAVGKRGDINKGGGCNLDGKRALLSALTEVPYPFPGPATSPCPEGLPVRKLEDLPDLSTGSTEGDVMVLETLLTKNNYYPIYVDLTRKDLEIPVTRAIIPGLEIVSDMDKFSRISPRLFKNYLEIKKLL
ncbi:YcaO-like family protein [Maridesulfovibrio ferrireducens]|uniref:YcaO-like family protein n=1 Tax=Maridesulfovibrio ferrireducens TaxID=246191 RepID=UPI001A318141|nr:YcaO-like family protein [Maridesulfovibrio ferrireducens]MBI9111488.1 YcaO-like family protein [Maridesulfovibrio ferrireducens]